jgi:hypothetical protein
MAGLFLYFTPKIQLYAGIFYQTSSYEDPNRKLFFFLMAHIIMVHLVIDGTLDLMEFNSQIF